MTLIGTHPQQDVADVDRSDLARLPSPRSYDAAEADRSSGCPSRSPELAHLTLDRLRGYRNSLLLEEVRVSYWRRILQARRDLLRAGSPVADHSLVQAVLTETRPQATRRKILTLHPTGGMPILPNLDELWDAAIDQDDNEALAGLFVDLGEAENVLSSYREALHVRLNRATADLVARYHEQPWLCLAALPRAA